MKSQIHGVSLPVITSIVDPGSNERDWTDPEMHFSIRLLKASCRCEHLVIPSSQLVQMFGRPWSCSMLERYAKTLAEQAADQNHSLHRFSKSQLSSIRNFAREKRFKLADVFDSSMQLDDTKAESKGMLLGPKLKAPLKIPDRLFIPTERINADDGQTWEVGIKVPLRKEKNPNHFPRLVNQMAPSKNQEALTAPVTSPSKRRSSRPPRDEFIYELVKKNSVKNLSTKKPYNKQKSMSASKTVAMNQGSSLGKRTDAVSLYKHHQETSSSLKLLK